MLEVAPGIRRVTQQLPLGIDHVHCYLVSLEGGGTMLVDTGLGLPGAEEWWRGVLAALEEPIEHVVVTHFHPDHLGGSGMVEELTGAPVHQGALDREQSLRNWSGDDWLDLVSGWFSRHGEPQDVEAGARADGQRIRRAIRVPSAPQVLAPGDEVAGWEAVPLPGHADGQLGLHRDGILLAGDHVLPDITPVVGAYPESSADPLADFVTSLGRVSELAPRLVLPGHGEPVRDPAARVHELLEHHRERLEATVAALDSEPRSAYEVSMRLWRRELAPVHRRMAISEALAHLERLVHEGGAVRTETAGNVAYTAS
jgi:glyoxylase-like metal-dependent hydrolase (beta-lactamase superfamily II)